MEDYESDQLQPTRLKVPTTLYSATTWNSGLVMQECENALYTTGDIRLPSASSLCPRSASLSLLATYKSSLYMPKENPAVHEKADQRTKTTPLPFSSSPHPPLPFSRYITGRQSTDEQPNESEIRLPLPKVRGSTGKSTEAANEYETMPKYRGKHAFASAKARKNVLARTDALSVHLVAIILDSAHTPHRTPPPRCFGGFEQPSPPFPAFESGTLDVACAQGIRARPFMMNTSASDKSQRLGIVNAPNDRGFSG
ncbi:hypothetical protein BDZ97DRAFT_1920217 [Flammula alnicola]|nr:hypothetical protein BDZ97DRAFT_1920217 [Flammula alnicola]